MMRIGVISDTHGFFDSRFEEFFSDCDEIWHAGDFGGGFATAAQIAEFKPLAGVVGNCDERALMYDYPIFNTFEREGLKILMTHIGGYPGHYDYHARQMIERHRPDIFVCGHSHILRVMSDPRYPSPSTGQPMLVINPGAAGVQGFHIVRTAIRFKISGKEISDMEIFELPR